MGMGTFTSLSSCHTSSPLDRFCILPRNMHESKQTPITSSASTMWAHLTRKDPTQATNRPDSTQSGSSSFPPPGPLDKTATTMRVLLHDTQMNLERFSGSVERLIEDVNRAEDGIKTTNLLFEKEHDKLMGDFIDLGSCFDLLSISLGRISKRCFLSVGSWYCSEPRAEQHPDINWLPCTGLSSRRPH